MALQEVSGITEDEIEELREEFNEKPEGEWYDLEERYCLFQIPHQPEDYDGPTRYCSQRARFEMDDVWRCESHKNRGVPNPENLTPGNPKHYMHATDEFLMDNLTEEEQKVYEEVLDWAEVYGINPDEDPAAYDDLKLLAKQRVREIKAFKYLNEEGEIVEKFVRDEEGNVVLDENGDPKTEDDTNPASSEYRRLVDLIRSLKKDLVVNRKERMKAEDRNTVAESADSTSEAMQELISDEEKTFNIDDYE